ncbi:hypothetical protein HOY82DRAFT_580006 [Tuber indicum]|nr:hypothetical protein HOY82DRAFT_580006 [Tuber indicum]
MSINRSLSRNVSFYDATHPDVALGGLAQNGSITEANFRNILGTLLVVDGSPLRARERISRVYDIYCDSSIRVSNEPWTPRLISHEIPSEEQSFRNDISNRDRKCADNWVTFEAVHIFPPEHQNLWIRQDYGRCITDMDDATQASKIDSIQNGFLLRSTLRQMFDGNFISINPDDGYKVIVFDIDLFGCDVLANVRGAGEPIFEYDFPAGTDMIGEISPGPYAQERFELEKAVRLREVF